VIPVLVQGHSPVHPNVPPVGTDLCAVITWVGLGLCVAEPHALESLSTCQLDLAIVTEFRSIERFRTQDTGHRTTPPML
jgi:hypothetical protein